ncbi:helix-turn-helix domain-containing protein [Uliginosibacterium sp. H1]|uniref:helix-turn-helix domain-containing protein n=1 Tax=Uliginosibacterium sp. H1 TaxID=3114757 RepID=UPI002E188A20|nr:helix-turn-helix domain-containing protein [Uliginosibacterium sp. H1]
MIRRWSTTLLPPARQAAFWQDAVSQAIQPMTVAPMNPAAFDATLTTRQLFGLRLHDLRVDAHLLSRGEAELGISDLPSAFLTLPLGGKLGIEQRGRSASHDVGQLGCFDSLAPLSLRFSRHTQALCLQMPLHMLADARSRIEAASATHLNETLPVARVLTASLHSLAGSLDCMSTTQQARCSQVLLDLAQAMWLPDDDIALRHNGSLVERARVLMRERISEVDLAPQELARRLGVSTRALHAAFAASGCSVMNALMELRLTLARHLLQASATELSVEQLARRCGFRSAAHFSRRFRERFGVPPSRWQT